MRRFGRVALLSVLLVAVVVGVGTLVVLRTQPGHDLVLRMVLNAVPRWVDGDVQVERLRADGLLRGFTLHGVSIADRNGRPFAEVDSLRIRYSARDLLRRQFVLVPVEIWGPRIVIERLHGDTRSNVSRLFSSADEDGADDGRAEDDASRPVRADVGQAAGLVSSDGSWQLLLRRTAIHDGELTIRRPVDDGEGSGRAVHERIEGEGAGRYRILRFSEIQTRISEAGLAGSERSGQTFRFDGLSVVGQVLDEPFRVEELRGEVVREGSSIRVNLDHLRTPGSELVGEVEVAWGEPEGVSIEADVEAPRVEFADFRWLEPRLPEGGGRLALSVSGPLARSQWRATDADVEVGGSRIRGRLGLNLGADLRFAETDLDLRPLRTRDLDRWLDEPLPFEGDFRGTLSIEGALAALEVDGELTFEDMARGIPPSDVRVEGTVGLGESTEVSDLTVVVDPLRYETLRAFLPDVLVTGEGRVVGTASGDMASSVQVTAEIEHRLDGSFSRVALSGSVRPSDRETTLALAGTLEPLSFDALAAALRRDLPVFGEVSGSVSARGPISDLLLAGALETAGGPLEAEARLDVRDPFRSYRIEGFARDFQAHLVAVGLPDPTVVNGEVLVEGAGAAPEELAGNATVVLDASRVGRAELESARARVRATEGRLVIDELDVESPGLRVSGSGDVALREDASDGRLDLVWAADSLSALRPLVFGEEGIAADTLTQLEREILRLEGVDPDTLGTSDGIVLRGSARGQAVLRGGIRDLDGEGYAELLDIAYGDDSVVRARADLRGGWRGAEDWTTEAVVDFDSLSLLGFGFVRGSGGLSYGSDGGDFDLTLEGRGSEAYAGSGMLLRDSTGLSVGFGSLTMRTEGAAWTLERPATVRFEGSAVRLDSLRLVESRDSPEGGGAGGAGAPSIVARGMLDLEGTSDFAVRFAGVELSRLGRLAQREDFPSGVLDLGLEVRGPAGAPRIDGEVAVRDLALNETVLSSLQGTFGYDDRMVRGRIVAAREGRTLATVEGLFPADLSFEEVEDRFPDRAMDVTIAVDSLPAATALSPIDAFEDVQGSLEGEIRLQGSPEDLRPTGEIRLGGGAFSIPGVGLRAREVVADLRVREDFAVEVQAEARAGGRAQVAGTVALSDLFDPAFDLQVSASGFQGVERRDLTARFAGDLSLTGSYSEPRIEGQATVERGELFLEEFIRGAEVIDLSDPRFFDVVDTTLVAARPVVAARNPFLQNLRVDVALSLDQDFWIRSRGETQGMDVEIAGDLTVNFDRPARELVLVGTLEAVRGSYTQFGARFAVESGTLEFPGTPGIDPSLGIEAVYRLRRQGAEPLNVLASLEGTLQAPRVTLSSDAQPPIPESDLISYLIFGRPSYALGSADASVVDQAIFNYAASQFGTSVSRSLGLDYVSISQANQETFADWSEQFADTQIEVGRYLGNDVFLSFALRPLTGLSSANRTLPSVRLEWRFSDLWSTEGFLEERPPRQGSAGFGELDDDPRRALGISLVREWGY